MRISLPNGETLLVFARHVPITGFMDEHLRKARQDASVHLRSDESVRSASTLRFMFFGIDPTRGTRFLYDAAVVAPAG